MSEVTTGAVSGLERGPALRIPQLSLVALVGVSGSGKTTFARRAFGRYEVISSDTCRGLVADDENDQAATKDAFDVLGYIASKRLAAGRLTVVDATNLTRQARKAVLDLAKEHDVLPVAIVFDVPLRVALERHRSRPDRPFGDDVLRRQQDQLRRSVKGLAREGFRVVHVLDDVEAVERCEIVREPLRNDLRHLTGPFDAIGDVHGCRAELEQLLDRLGYQLVRDDRDRPVDAVHPQGRTVVFLGDLVDRGPDSPGVLRLAMGMTAAGHALAVPGNHEHKLVRALRGRAVRIGHGLAETLTQLAGEPEEFRGAVQRWCDGLVSHLVLDGGRLVVAHAGLKEAYHGRASGRVRSFALYGDTTGETDEYGLPVRYPWAEDYRGPATVLYGHTPVPEAVWLNKTLCLDTGCVFGGKLSALRYPEKELVQVAALRVWYEPVKPLTPATPSTPVREAGRLDLTDVLGHRVVETRHLGRVSVRPENAAGALEVISRFALHPILVPYLPPTMAPVATSTRAGLLEHPDEAFSAYASAGVEQVICQEKHMGSRAVVLLNADPAAPGAVYTRTGRAFFDAALTEQLLDRLRAAVTACGLWQELATDRLLLDAELMPWSVKAEALLRDQYAATGAAARSALDAASRAIEQAMSRGAPDGDDQNDQSDSSALGALHDRTVARRRAVQDYTSAYRRYCWPVDGLDGVRLAPFQVLAADGATYYDRDHLWHLAIADRLAAVEPLVQSTRHLVVDPLSGQSCAAGTTWWQELTDAGGEGMVVKPLANLTRGRRGLVQPGLKVRGREYLRIIYGPEYTIEQNLTRLRERAVGTKRSLALREYALGLEALDRLAAGEPLWRVHECVFAVLALESEPVDPRL